MTSSVPQMILIAAQDAGVDPGLALAVATQESGMWWQAGKPVPDSSAGAIGIFQLMPATAQDLGVDPRDPQQNIEGGVRYLGNLLARFDDPMAAVAAYDWGQGNVSAAISKYGTPGWTSRLPAETSNYLKNVFGVALTQYQSQAAASNAAPFATQGEPDGVSENYPQMLPTPAGGSVFLAPAPQSDGTGIVLAIAAIAAVFLFA